MGGEQSFLLGGILDSLLDISRNQAIGITNQKAEYHRYTTYYMLPPLQTLGVL